MKLIPVILSGGAGARLWPVSRALFPKQLVPLANERSLFQQTLARIERLAMHFQGHDILPPVVVCNEQHRFMIAQQAQALKCTLTSIILEPCAKNTAPALTLAAEYIQQHCDDAVMLVLPADHAVADEAAFCDSIKQLFDGIQADHEVGILGIQPIKPHTGFGYIEVSSDVQEKQIQHVVNFKEKPDEALAQKYLDAGNYYWNSGMFMLSATMWNRVLKEFVPGMSSACREAIRQGQEDLDFFRVASSHFEVSPADSIDYAVIEKVDALSKLNIGLKMIPINCGWNDLGAWPSVAEYLGEDEQGNVFEGDVISDSTSNTLVFAQQRLVATVGVDNLIVVETPDAVLVADKSQAQHVKNVVQNLKVSDREEHISHSRVYRPWGNYETVDYGDRYQVKRIIVNPGASLSLQMHHHRAEHWIVVHGTAEVTCNDKVFLLSENESTYIPIGTKHRLVNPGKFPLELIEVQSGSYLGEDDIVRYEDIYGREKE